MQPNLTMEGENESANVSYLIHSLCGSIARQNDVDAVPTFLRKLKVKAFAILLNKTRALYDHDQEPFDAQRAFAKHLFTAKLRHNRRTHDADERIKLQDLERRVDELFMNTGFVTGSGGQILQLLLALHSNMGIADDSDTADIMTAPYVPKLLLPGPFTLHANYQQNGDYHDLIYARDLLQPQPRYFKGLTPLKAHDNPYIPKCMVAGRSNCLADIEAKYSVATLPTYDIQCTFSGVARRKWDSLLRMNVGPFRLFGDCGRRSCVPRTPVTATRAKTITTKPTPAATLEPERIYSWNWENRGRCGVERVKPLASEACVMHYLQCEQNQLMGGEFEARIVSQAQLLQDLKSLTVGIESDIFQYNEYFIFYMQPNITVTDVLSATIDAYVQDFLECGTCYKRLQTMIMKCNYKLKFDGFIFKALCSAVDEYLLTFRQFVFAVTDTHLLAFYRRMQKSVRVITHLCHTLTIHPNVAANAKLPTGSQLLGYLYREITRLTKKEYIQLLTFILKRCCHVYFKHLQKWIFYGLLDDPSQELFIRFIDHYRPETKYFYDKAYFVHKDVVPGFFQNLDEQILQCGKYTMLLKSCKPNHPLFEMTYPSISVCLSFEEIQKMEANCNAYYERARAHCGETLSIPQYFDTRREQIRNFIQLAGECTTINLAKWAEEKRTLAELVALRKEQCLTEWSQQLLDAKQRKIDERRANVEQELRSLREIAKLEEYRDLRDNINLRKRIDYYQEISDNIRMEDIESARVGTTPPPRSPASAGSANFEERRAKVEQELKSLRDIAKLEPNRGLRDNINLRKRIDYYQEMSENLQMEAIESNRTGGSPSPRTPASTMGTEFESCDDDANSDYGECISAEFVVNFADTEKTLQAMCEKNSGLNSKNLPQNVNVGEKTERPPVVTTLKRSNSDVLNCNELPAVIVTRTATEEQREYSMAGTDMAHCLQHTGAALIVKTTSPILSDAQRNKLKMLGTTQEVFSGTAMPPADINLNTLAGEESSELQRNRRRMMQNDPFMEYNRDPLAERAQLYLDLDSDRARNRRKVLESEYNLVTGQKSDYADSGNETGATLSLKAAALLTPMSTTSDAPLSSGSASDSMLLRTDAINGNDASVAPRELLTVDIALAQQQQMASDECKDVETTRLNTPEHALNTCGLMARQGFDYALSHEQQRARQLEAIREVPIQTDSFLLDEEGETPVASMPNDMEPYQRCVELIENNFQCAPRCGHLRLNKPASSTAAESSARLQQLNVNSMSVITLTEFLHKSVLRPMSVHLQLLNSEVLRLFLDDLQTFEHFRSLRHYFFLMDGEFGAKICNEILEQLDAGAAPQYLLNYQMLHTILYRSLGSSIMGCGKNAANLSFIVKEMPKRFDHASPSVLETLSLSYRVAWPLNIILNPEVLELYGAIFRYLLKVRRISWLLERAYQMLNEAVKKHGATLSSSPQYRHVQQIRHKLYHFVHALQHHITANALQASWKTFKDKLLQAQSIEDIQRKHWEYVKRIRFLCMLNRSTSDYYNTIENIFIFTLQFYNNLKECNFELVTTVSSGAEYRHARYDALVANEVEFDRLIEFTIYLGQQIVQRHQAELNEFISLINYNEYYSASREAPLQVNNSHQ